MREVRLAGVSADGGALVVEVDGEHLRLSLDAAVRAAVAHPEQPALAFASPISPREVQRRIRMGESAAQIAAGTGVSVERVARWERPVLEERHHQAARGQAALVRGRPLAELAREHADRVEDGADLSWDARLAEDGTWRLVLLFSTGVAACWSWTPATAHLEPLERVARTVTTPEREDPDAVLQAVLRPLGGSRAPSGPAGARDVESEAPALAAPEPSVPGEASAELAPTVAAGVRRRLRGRRSEVPSWDDITAGTAPQEPRG